MSPPTPPGPPAPLKLPPELPRPRRDRSLGWGLAISVVLHGLALGLYPYLVGTPRSGGSVDYEPPDTPPQGIEVISVVEVNTDISEQAAPREVEQVSPAAPAVDVDLGELAGEIIEALDLRPRTAADRLRVREGDPRLWLPILPELLEISEERMAQLRIAWAIEEFNDSAMARAADAAAALDWTFMDDDGNKWGISQGKLHLGGITLPLPSFGAPYGSAYAQYARDAAEINGAEGRLITQESLDERAKAIRERRDRARAEQRARADTTRSGGGRR